MNIVPLGDRVLIRPEEAIKKTESGIIIPDNAQEKSNRGVIVRVGSEVPKEINTGATVIYSQYAGSELTSENETLVLLHTSDILALEEEV